MTLPDKPAYGAPCNGCGYCCTLEPCGLAFEFLDPVAGQPCPALEVEAGRTFCGLVRRPVHYLLNRPDLQGQAAPVSVAFAYMLRLGAGCDAEAPDE